MEELRWAAWNRKLVRDYCELVCVPSIFESLETGADGNCIGNFNDGFKVNQKYIDGKKKADAMFDDIMSSPEKIQRTVSVYSRFLQEKHIDELESELASLKEEREENKESAQQNPQ